MGRNFKYIIWYIIAINISISSLILMINSEGFREGMEGQTISIWVVITILVLFFSEGNRRRSKH